MKIFKNLTSIKYYLFFASTAKCLQEKRNASSPAEENKFLHKLYSYRLPLHVLKKGWKLFGFLKFPAKEKNFVWSCTSSGSTAFFINSFFTYFVNICLFVYNFIDSIYPVVAGERSRDGKGRGRRWPTVRAMVSSEVTGTMGTLPTSLPNLMVQAGCCVTGDVYQMISGGVSGNPVMRESCNCTNIFGDLI